MTRATREQAPDRSGGEDGGPAPDDDERAVARLLGRAPMGAFDVVVREPTGRPLVIRNAPLMDDGTPMPTRYWLVDDRLRRRVSTLEAAGGVRGAEAAVDGAELARAHAVYSAERDAALPPGHQGPRPAGGVGGTRKGVKCLHAHYAWFLAGGDDPVGRWVADRLASDADRPDPDRPGTDGAATGGLPREGEPGR